MSAKTAKKSPAIAVEGESAAAFPNTYSLRLL
jgi:hypothetical protein